MCRSITESELNPVIRGANYFTSANIKFGPRYNYGYQLLYVFDGGGTAEVEACSFILEPGMLFIYGPGHRHEFRSRTGQDITLGTVYFSCHIVPDKQMSMTNDSVMILNEDFQKYADELVNIEGLPHFPFCIKLHDEARKQTGMHLRTIAREFNNAAQSGSQLYVKSHLLEVFLILKAATRNAPDLLHNSKIAEFEIYIKENYARELKRFDVSSKINISESYLTALLKKRLQTNFTDYLTRVRLEKAMELIQYSDLLIKEISDHTGFKSVSYFVHRFGEYYGESPNKFRQ
jgi:AraC-like DNA-binding protein